MTKTTLAAAEPPGEPLTYRRHWSKFGPHDRLDIISDGTCPGPHCEQVSSEDGEFAGWRDRRIPATLAHVGFEIVAMTLAEPLRRAFFTHADEHQCQGRYPRCPEYARLAALLPEGDEPVLLASP